MKKRFVFFAMIAVFAVLSVAYAQYYKTFFTNNTFPVSAATTDTSSSKTLQGFPCAEIITSITGTDSVRMITNVQGYASDQWVTMIRDTFITGDATANLKYNTIYLRGMDGSTNQLAGVETIRVIVTTLVTGTSDSTAATSYDMKLLLYGMK